MNLQFVISYFWGNGEKAFYKMSVNLTTDLFFFGLYNWVFSQNQNPHHAKSPQV